VSQADTTPISELRGYIYYRAGPSGRHVSDDLTHAEKLSCEGDAECVAPVFEGKT
jgi:hypothetical protein